MLHLQAFPSSPRSSFVQLRVAQVTNGAASKVGKIKLVRKNIARVLTVISQKGRAQMTKKLQDSHAKYIPKQLREKKTRAIRRALTKEQVRAERHGGLGKGVGSERTLSTQSPHHSHMCLSSSSHLRHFFFSPQASKLTVRAEKKKLNFAVRKFAITA